MLKNKKARPKPRMVTCPHCGKVLTQKRERKPEPLITPLGAVVIGLFVLFLIWYRMEVGL